MGKIEVTVQREDRLKAIVNLSKAIKEVACALNSAPRINISGCNISNVDTGINLMAHDEVTKTIIMEIDEDK